MKAKEENPLKGVSVPSIADIVQEVMNSLGLAVLDLGKQEDRERLRRFLANALRCSLRWRLGASLEQATSKALAHVFALMEDEHYQETRARRRKLAAEQKRERIAERARLQALERETRRQKRTGLVQ